MRKRENEREKRKEKGGEKDKGMGEQEVFTSQVAKLLETNCFSVASCYQQLLKDSSVEVHFNFSVEFG